MIDLVILACLAGAPATCRAEPVPFDGPVMACALYGQIVAAEWAASHPKWRVTGWRCGPREVRT